MYRIRRFGVMKTATVAALMYVVVIAVIFVPIALLVAIASPTTAEGFGAGAVGAGGVLVVGLLIALFYGAIGWIFTAIACALYNVVAGWVGGIEVQLEGVAPPPPAPTWGVVNPSQPGGTPTT